MVDTEDPWKMHGKFVLVPEKRNYSELRTTVKI